MTPGKLRPEVVAERSAWVRDMRTALATLPLTSFEEFTSDPRNPAAAESFLRRGLEGLLDLGRHVLAKGFGRPTTEYRDIAQGLEDVGVLDPALAGKLREMAGFRNRLVHFYDRVTHEELFRICRDDAGDVDTVLAAIVAWVQRHTSRDGAE